MPFNNKLHKGTVRGKSIKMLNRQEMQGLVSFKKTVNYKDQIANFIKWKIKDKQEIESSHIFKNK